MRKFLLIFIIFLVLLNPAACLSNRGIFVNYDNRLALVIGNGDYKNAPLSNPFNDARDFANILIELEFKVKLETNASQRTMEESIRNFGKELRKGGVGLFYYAGHGIQFRGKNYLIPVNAKIESEADVKYEAVEVGRLLSQMDEAGNNFNIIILDACRNNPHVHSGILDGALLKWMHQRVLFFPILQHLEVLQLMEMDATGFTRQNY